MKKVTIILGTVLLAASLMSFQAEQECKTKCENLQIEDITFVEVEEEFELGFDTAQYLPEGFNPYIGMGLNLDDIVIIEELEEIDLGFDTAQYLPEDFNAYEGMVFDIDEIEYIEEEEEIILDFDVQAYLPIDFKELSK